MLGKYRTRNALLLTLCRQITCLYDMDIVFRPDGNFDEVYLYVRNSWTQCVISFINGPTFRRNSWKLIFMPLLVDFNAYNLPSFLPFIADSIPTTPFRCSFPILHLLNSLWSQIHPLRQRSAPWPQTRQSPRQRRLWTQDLWFRARPWLFTREQH